MNGAQHITSGIAILAFDVSLYYHIMTAWDIPKITEPMQAFAENLTEKPILTGISGLFFLGGLLIPDCDNPNSMAGKRLHLPFDHRTWMHSIWLVLFMFIAGFAFYPFWFMSLGCFIHLFCDSFSRQGVCWFYPISNYKHYGSAKIKKGHYIYLYGGPIGEGIAWLLCLLMIILTGFTIAGVFLEQSFMFKILSKCDTIVNEAYQRMHGLTGN